MTQLAESPTTTTSGPDGHRVVGLRRDLVVQEDDDRPGLIHLRGARGSGTVGPLTQGVSRAVRALAGGPLPEEVLSRLATEAEDESAVLPLQMLLRRMDAAGLLEHSVCVGDAVVATLVVAGRGGVGPLAAPARHRPVKLSRFAVVRPVDGRLRVEAPRSPQLVELLGAGTSVLAPLADWMSPDDPDVTSSLPARAFRETLALLATAGLLTAGGDEHDPETRSAQWAPWSATDLWLHARSQGPELREGYGGTYPLRERFAPWPAVAPDRGLERVVLDPPAPVDPAGEPSLAAVMEQRRSVREHDDARPITRDELGTLLHRCLRTVGVYESGDHEVCSRPHPGGGALYELEVYPVVTSCRGLDPGVWHYDPVEHALEYVAAASDSSDTLVRTARTAALMERPPQVLLVVTARFGRVMWKYEGMAYALVLKNVGVVYQTLYLVATAMGLAPCALGGGDAAAFAAASGIEYGLEGSVGAFLVGSRPADQSVRFAPPER